MASGPLFGGTAGAWVSVSPSSPPARAYRVIPGSIWWTLIFWPWRQYLAARATGRSASPPWIAPFITPGGVFFTDAQSLQGVLSSGDFARRVGLSPRSQADCQVQGCAVIEFDTPSNAIQPPPYPGCAQGLTVGGAREWMAPGNVALADTMTVTYVDTTRSGPRNFVLPL